MPPLETTITAVTVFTGQARITRQGNLMVQPGEQTVILPDLPEKLVENSVRVSGRGTGIRILAVEVKTRFPTVEGDEVRAALQKRLEDWQAQDSAKADQQQMLNDRLALLDEARQQAGQQFGKMIAYGRATLDDYATFARFATDEQTGLQAERRAVSRERAELQKAIKAAEQELQQRGQAGRSVRPRREIHVVLDAAAATVFDLEATYLLPDASWKPLYDVRLNGDQVELTYLAQITQRTGEDWTNVQLALSTARPALSATLPELQPHYIAPPLPAAPPAALRRGRAEMQASGAERALMKSVASAGDDADELVDQVALAAPAPQAAAAIATVEAGSGGMALTYRVNAPVTIPADGSPHKTTVIIEKLRAALDYLTVPKLAAEAYLRAKITNTLEVTLLPGEAAIYHADDYVGKTLLKTIAPGEEFEVQLGVDDRVRVKRELVQREVNRRLIGSNRQIQYKYRITLTSLLTQNLRLSLTDQFPVSRHEQIKTRLTEASPAVSEHTDLNILKWDLVLKPGEKREITFAYLVEHPTDLPVPGLE